MREETTPEPTNRPKPTKPKKIIAALFFTAATVFFLYLVVQQCSIMKY